MHAFDPHMVGHTIGHLRAAVDVLYVVGDNMTVALARTFLTVVLYEGRSAREYGELLGLGGSSISRHLLDLGDINRKREPGMRLLQQHPDPMDRRKNIYRLTPRGRGVINQLVEVMS